MSPLIGSFGITHSRTRCGQHQLHEIIYNCSNRSHFKATPLIEICSTLTCRWHTQYLRGFSQDTFPPWKRREPPSANFKLPPLTISKHLYSPFHVSVIASPIYSYTPCNYDPMDWQGKTTFLLWLMMFTMVILQCLLFACVPLQCHPLSGFQVMCERGEKEKKSEMQLW